MVSKGKSSNPLDAHRKAAKQRELKRNKEQRDKAREARQEELDRGNRLNAEHHVGKRPRIDQGASDRGEGSSRNGHKVPLRSSQGPLKEEEEEEDEESDEDAEQDDEIAMPLAPPPAHTDDNDHELEDGASTSSEDSDGIVMPQGPPPLPPAGPRADRVWPPLPPGPVPPENYVFRQAQPASAAHNRSIPPFHSDPPPFAPTRYQSGPPLDGSAQQHGHLHPRQHPAQPQQPSVPPGPPPPRPSAVISAAPQLRDLKKEATAFVPTALRKRQAAATAQAAKGGLSSAVNAAPGAEESASSEKTDLLSTLQPHIGTTQAEQDYRGDLPSSTANTAPPISSTVEQAASSAANDDYKRFLGEIGDLL